RHHHAEPEQAEVALLQRTQPWATRRGRDGRLGGQSRWYGTHVRHATRPAAPAQRLPSPGAGGPAPQDMPTVGQRVSFGGDGAAPGGGLVTESREPLGSDPSLATACQRLAELASLEPDWDSYGADPPTALAVTTARSLLEDVAQRAAARIGVDP